MDCLKDYIGIRATSPAVGRPAPESGLFINDLPGITIAQLSDLSNSDQSGFLDLWDAVQRRAARVFETGFTNAMSRKFRLKKITEAYKLAETIDPDTTFAPLSGELRGIYMDCYIGRSAFHHIPLSVVRIYLPDTPANVSPLSIQLKVYDVQDDKLTELDSYAVSLTTGWNTVYINKKYYDSRTLYIAYDASAIQSASIPLDSLDLNPYQYADLAQFFSHIYINGATYDSATGRFTATSDETYGMTATLGLQCSFDTLVCNYKQNLAVAWWYLLGSELMKERIYTDRVNRYTTVDLSKARELMQSLHADYMNELMTFVDSINLQNDWCVECDTMVRTVEFLP
jgi:hypothetical protein